MAAKKCLICNSPFSGRRDAKTCSAKCRKRLQKVRWSFYVAPAKKQLAKTLLVVLVGAVSALSMFIGMRPSPATAATSSYLNFQSRLLTNTGSVVADGNYNIEFKIYRSLASGSSVQGTCVGGVTDDCLWMETRTSTDKVRVVNGYMSVNLGSVTSFPSINWDQPLWLTMNIGGTGAASWDGEMNPRITLTALPYAFRAGTLAKTDGSGNVGTLSFNTTANTPVITLPDASGTVCLQTSSSCGFLTSTTGVQLQGSTPGTQQTGHFNISGTGIAGTSLLTPSITVATAGALGIANSTATAVNIGNTGSNITTTVTGLALFKPSTGNDSTTAFRIQNAAGSTTLFTADTQNTRIGIGGTPATSLLTIGTNTMASSGGITLGTDTNLYRAGNDTLASDDGLILQGSGANDALRAGGASYSVGTITQSTTLITAGGGATFTNAMEGGTIVYSDGTSATVAYVSSSFLLAPSKTISTPSTYTIYYGGLRVASGANAQVKIFSDSTTAFHVQNANGTGNLLTADTVNARVGIGIGVANATLHVSAAGGGTDLFRITDTTATAQDVVKVADGGAVTLRNQTNSTSAFQIQNALGSNALSVDTTALSSLNTNGSAEGTDVTAWSSKQNATVTRDTSQTAYLGSASIKTVLGGTTAIGDGVKYTMPSSIGAGTYTLSFAIEQTAGTAFGTNLQVGSNNGSDNNCTLAPTLTAQPVPTTGWARYSCTFVTTGTTTYIYWKQADAAASARTFFLDAVQLETGSTANAFKETGIALNGVITSPAIFKNQSNSTAAFQVQNAAGTALLNVDTLNSNVSLAASTSLTINGGNTASRPSSPTEGMIYYDTTTKQLLVYANSKWQADRTTATKIVGDASTTQNYEKADYVVPAAGTSAQSTINTAISALPAGGGIVYLLDGTYTVDGSITLPSNVTLAGSGASTVIKVKDSLNGAIDVIARNAAGVTRLSVKNLKLDGNKANNSSGTQRGIFMTGIASSTTPGIQIDGVYAENFRTDGINLTTSPNSQISNSIAVSNDGIGIALSTNNNTTLTNNISRGNASFGFRLGGDNVTATSNTASSNTAEGFNLNTCNYCSISGNTSTSSTGAAGLDSLSSSNNNSIVGNTFSSNADAGIIIRGTSNTVSDNSIYNNTSRGIYIYISATYNLVIGNRLDNNAGSGATDNIKIDQNADNNTLTNNRITDTAGSGCAINFATSNVPVGTYLSSNIYSGTGANSICNIPTNTTQAVQLTANNDMAIQTAGGINVGGTGSALGSVNVQGGYYGSQLATPSAPTVTSAGTTGAATYQYKITALDGTGETAASAQSTGTTNGNATLSSTNYSQVAFSITSGAVQYKVYRTNVSGGSPGTTGLISTITINSVTYPSGVTTYSSTCAASGSTSIFSSGQVVFKDTGCSASGSVPTINTTGGGTFTGNVLIKPAGDNTTAFQVQNSAGNNYILVNTSGASISIGDTSIASTVQVGNTTGAVTQTINIGNNSTGSSTNNVNIGSSIAGTTAITGPTTVTNRTSGSSDTLVVSNSTSTGTIAKFQDNSTTVFSLADGGAALFQNQTNSTNAFQIQNTAGTRLFNVNNLTTGLNLITNSDIESNLNGWSAKSTATLTLDDAAANANFGSRTMKVVTAATARGAQYTYPFKASTQYSLSIYAKVSASTQAYTIGRQDASGTDVDTGCSPGNNSITVTTTWTQYTCTFTTGGTITPPSSFYIKQSGAGTPTMYIDGVTLVQASTAQAFVQPATNLQMDANYSNITLNYTNSGEIQAWQLSPNALPAARREGGSVYANGYLYLIGGASGQNTVYYAKVNADGSTGAWQTNTYVLPASIYDEMVVAANGYIYAIGGWNGSALTSVYYAKLNADGSTGAWQTNTNTLPAARALAGVATANGYVYIVGGFQAADVSTVYYAKINGDGSIAPWQTNVNSLPSSASNQGSVVANGYLYSIRAGQNFYAKLNADGSTGAWSTGPNLTVQRSYPAVMVSNGYVYAIGGETSGPTCKSEVEYARLNSDGSLGNWVTSSYPQPATFSRSGYASANGYMYIMGGNNCTSDVSTVYYTSTSRIQMSGSLDLVGLSGQTLNENGGAGGSLTAGNTTVVGTLDVRDQANFSSNVNINSTLTVNGSTNIRAAQNSTSMFQAQNASGVAYIQATTVNLVGNTTFESGTSGQTPYGWTTKGTGATVTNSTTFAQFGSTSMSVVTTGTNNAGATYNYPLQPSTQYSVSFYARSSAGAYNITIGRQDVGADIDTGCSPGSNTAALTTTFTRFTCTFTTGATISGTPNIYLKDTSNTHTFYVDGVQLETAAATTDYREGDIRVDGKFLFKNSADNTTAFQIQNQAGTNLLSIDTTNGKVMVGTSDTTGQLLVLDTDTDATILSGTGTSAATEVDGAMFYSSTSRSFVCGQNGQWLSCLGGLRSSQTAASNAITAAADTNFSGGTGISYTIPANDCVVGRVYRVNAYGRYTVATAARTVNFKVKFGSTVLATTVAVATNAPVNTNAQWSVHVDITCISTGGSGSVEAQGFATIQGATTDDSRVSPMVNSAVIGSIDTTATQTLQLSAGWDATTNAPTLTMRSLVIEGIGP